MLEGSERTVDDALGALEDGAPSERVLVLLEATATEFVAEDRIHRLVPHARRLATLDFAGHPWAALPAGVAICAIDRPLGRQILSSGRKELERRTDRDAAYGWFLEGLQDLGEGNLEGATAWWRRAQGSLDPGLTAARLTLAHLALGAYERAELPEAIVLAQEALWNAERVGDARTEAVASIYLGFFHLYTGRFACCELMTDRAAVALERLPVEDRYELPLIGIERGALAAFRDDRETCEQQFRIGLEQAATVDNEWYTAIGLAARAEFTAQREPVRAVADARGALDRLDPIDESWWSRWARLALATANLHAGNDHAGRQGCRALLDTDLNALERGRTLLVLAELELRSGSERAAGSAALESQDLLTAAGADFWAARSLLLLSRIDRRQAEFHRRRARQLAAGDSNDLAWRRVLRGPGRLSIRLLGDAEVVVDGAPVRFATRSEIEVIAMLAATDGPLRTSVIGDRLWPDDDPAKVAHRIDNLLSSVRRALVPTSRLWRERGLVSLDLDASECDLVDALRRSRAMVAGVGEDATPPERTELSTTLRRPFLGSLEAPWVTLEQERLQDLADRIEAG